jgi:hypothetical protein
MNEKDITNGNVLNLPSLNNYESFNNFIFSNDIKLIGKLLHRFEFYLKTKDLAGDIVEVGVFKGSGVASFSKFIDIYNPRSNKKVIGFDIFDSDEANIILNKDSSIDKETMNIVYNRVNKSDLTIESVNRKIKECGVSEDKFNLVKGDVEQTLPQFLIDNPGFRISLLYIDVDIERPTYNTLKYLWDRILPGGYILFDEYEYHKFSESCGVEKFLKEKNINYNVKSTNWIAPTAYIKKETF